MGRRVVNAAITHPPSPGFVDRLAGEQSHKLKNGSIHRICCNRSRVWSPDRHGCLPAVTVTQKMRGQSQSDGYLKDIRMIAHTNYRLRD